MRSSVNQYGCAYRFFYAHVLAMPGVHHLPIKVGALRWDASSTFGDDERWQLYPKLSGSYVLSETGWWQDGPGDLALQQRGAAKNGQSV